MRFENYNYERPAMAAFKTQFQTALEQFKQAKDVHDAEKALKGINALRFDFETMQSLASIRHTIDTKDEFYDGEYEFFNDNRPQFEQLENQFYRALSDSPFKDRLKETIGSLLFDKAEQTLRTFSDAIMDDLKQENKLSSQYQKLVASAEIEFEGETRNLSQMAPFVQHLDRSMRKKASLAVSGFFKEHEQTLDEIYDKLVKVRTKIAKTLGYDNFIDLAYDRLGRLDYNADDVANYRKQVKDNLVPLVGQLIERQGNRLCIDDMLSYDLPLQFLSGNPTPKGEKDFLVNQAKAMYKAMSPETETFFNFMIDKNLVDLESKKGKAGGGYCTYIANHQSPFIFANFNGTSHDVDVLTHEAGHAFQVFSSRHHIVPEYMWPTLEACEIHSMSMEFFAWPWIDKFFNEDTEKYKFSHIAGSLTFIPYGVAVDEFQHEVYRTPDMTPDARKALWRAIEEKYLPYKKYDTDDFFGKGTMWFRQGHIFEVPFYYIDYTLAQVCAFQYWIKDQNNHQNAWESYHTLCKAGGSKSFLNLLKLAELNNPFIDGTIAKTVPALKAFLDGVDDTKL